jgi:CDP-4-dehydro-6-deoxyglucose reductase, E1
MKTEKEIRDEIFKRVAELYSLRNSQKKRIPGKDNLSYAGRVYDEKEMISLVDASLDFWLTSGRYAKRFEEELARFVGVDHCLLTNSGSSANLIAVSTLTSPKLGKKRLLSGDEVITTACGFPTTLNPIIQNGLVPVFVDVDAGSYNIKADEIESAIGDRTRAIFVPHTLGNPVNIEVISDLAQRYDLWFIEDNCDALGSKYKGRYTGSFGDISTCSFYPAHHITMGEGGAVLTSNQMLKNIAVSFRDWGRDCWCDPGCDNTCKKRFGWHLGSLPEGYDHKYIYTHIGYNLKATDMQAAVGVEQLKKLPAFIKARIRNFERLHSGLKKYEHCLMLARVECGSEPSWFGFPLLVRSAATFGRDELVCYLEEHKIATRMLFGGNLTKQPAYQDLICRIPGSLQNTDLVMNSLFWIGVYPGLDERDIDYILKTFDNFMGKFECI